MLLKGRPLRLRAFFYFWASRRGLGGDASKRRKHILTDQRRETLAPLAAPSGFPLQCFWPPSSYGAYAIRPYEHHMYGRVAYALMPKTFPLQSLSHARPRHHHVSRRTIQSPRPHLDPAPRTPWFGNLTVVRIRLATGYRHATANAVGARARVCSPATATTTARIDSVYVAI